MYFLTESQANWIATDYQFLVGKPLSKESEFTIEEVRPDIRDGRWTVFLVIEPNDIPADVELWTYLADNPEVFFDPGKYGLSPHNKA